MNKSKKRSGVLPENWSSSYERITDNFGIVFAFRKETSHEETFQWDTDNAYPELVKLNEKYW